MSRIRSQLDEILESRRQARAQHPPQPVAVGGGDGQPPKAGGPDATVTNPAPEMDQLRNRLNQLVGKLDEVKRGRPQHSSDQSPAADGREPASAPDVFRAPVRESPQQEAGDDLQQEIGRISQAIHALQQEQPLSREMLETMRSELHGMHETMRGMTGQGGTSTDLSAITQSIETGYAEIAAMLSSSDSASMAVEMREQSERVAGQISGLSDHIHAIRDAVDHLPVRVPVEEMEKRLSEIGNSINALTGGNDSTLPQHLQSIEERLDEITRALVAVSINPHGDNDGLERIEARLATLAKSVEDISGADPIEESALQTHFSELSAGLTSEIRDAVERVENRLAQVEVSSGETQLPETVHRQLAEMNGKLDAFLSQENEKDGGIATVMMERVEAIAVRIDDIAQGLHSLQDDDGQRDAASETDGEILQLLQGLMNRMDGLDTASDSSGVEGGQLTALENQLSEIAARLDTASAGGADLEPVNERLASIEQQVALSRDIAIDVASQAAERALQMAGSMPSADPQKFEALVAEIERLKAHAEEMDVRQDTGFDTIHQSLTLIAERLDEISADYAQSDPVAEYEQPASEAKVQIENTDYAETGDYSANETPAMEAEPQQIAEPQASARVEERTETAPFDTTMSAEEAPSLDMDDLPEVEDVPLEPGSGVPDLAALVQSAEQRRNIRRQEESSQARSEEVPDEGEIKSDEDEPTDYFTAVRRAQRAASTETKPDADKQEKDAKKSTAPSARLASLRKLLAGRSKPILLVAAIVLFVIFAIPIVSRLMGGGEQTASAPSQPAQNRTIAGTSPVQPDVSQENIGANEAAATTDTSTIAENTEETAEPTLPAEQTSGQLEPSPATTTDQSTENTASIPGRSTDVSDPAEPSLAPASGKEERLARPITSAPMPPADTGNIALRQAAANGNGAALFEVARRYTDGEGVERDLKQAAQWYEHSANTGFAPAQYRLANFIEKGHGVDIDIAKAAKWYERAAEQGNALAMHNLAVLHTSGLTGGKPDMNPAIDWFNKAAELGVKDSQVNLGIIYAKGIGAEADLAKAYKWFAIAARGGDADAASKRDTIANAMRPDQLQIARGEAEIWKPREIDTSANSVTILPEWKSDTGQSAAVEKEEPQALSTRELIAKAQELLARQGYDPGPADGLMGERTRHAIMQYQEKAGLPADGEVTPELLEKLASSSV